MKFALPIISLLSLILLSCNQKHDLAISNVDIFDAEKGVVIKNKTILINGTTITAIVSGNEKVSSKLSIDGLGRLVTPGFVDTHIHLTSLYGDYDQAPELIPEDSVENYRNKLSQTYLSYGVTTIKVAGQPEKWIKPTLDWQHNPMPDYPDI